MSDLLKEFEDKLRRVIDSVDVIRFDLEQPGDGHNFLLQEFQGSVHMLKAVAKDANDAHQSIRSALERSLELENSLSRDREAHSAMVRDWQEEAEQKEARLGEREKALQDRQDELVRQNDQLARDRATANAEQLSAVTNAIRGQVVHELRSELDIVMASIDERAKLADALRESEEQVKQCSDQELNLHRELQDLQQQHNELRRDYEALLQKQTELDAKLSTANEQLGLADTQRIQAVDDARLEVATEDSREIGTLIGKLDAQGAELCREQVARRDADTTNLQLSSDLGRLTQEARQLRIAYSDERSKCREHEREIERLTSRFQDLETPLSQFAVSRHTSEDGVWQNIVSDIDIFLFDFRPNVEFGSSLSLADVVLLILPFCWSAKSKTNLSEFLEEADPAEWYCFQQVIEISLRDGHDGSLVPEGAYCPVHGSDQCIQVRLGRTRSSHPSIIFRSVVDGIETTLTPAQLDRQEESEVEEL
ncbi:hypothetical protein F4820DRAFT_154773 [Hypoxylon rubiginosum]|uniref:Uncharacterized protein n=1 Tax=Hypoxylon rubiginosum TaxID=110542 RepID=A0ACB9ZAP5_9PEZI|nr:hypothetical protein F4820DRAFT_154773 [Hypoxylon rubiginosum]